MDTRFNYSGTCFGFNHDAVSLKPQNSEFLPPIVLLQGQHTLLYAEVALLVVLER